MLYAARKHGYLGVVLDGALVIQHERVIVARAQEHARDGREHRPGEPSGCFPAIDEKKKRKKRRKEEKKENSRKEIKRKEHG
jgi:hypothetical protein